MLTTFFVAAGFGRRRYWHKWRVECLDVILSACCPYSGCSCGLQQLRFPSLLQEAHLPEEHIQQVKDGYNKKPFNVCAWFPLVWPFFLINAEEAVVAKTVLAAGTMTFITIGHYFTLAGSFSSQDKSHLIYTLHNCSLPSNQQQNGNSCMLEKQPFLYIKGQVNYNDSYSQSGKIIDTKPTVILPFKMFAATLQPSWPSRPKFFCGCNNKLFNTFQIDSVTTIRYNELLINKVATFLAFHCWLKAS